MDGVVTDQLRRVDRNELMFILTRPPPPGSGPPWGQTRSAIEGVLEMKARRTAMERRMMTQLRCRKCGHAAGAHGPDGCEAKKCPCVVPGPPAS